ISALDYAVANGAHISNNSWGGGGHSAALEQAIRSAAAAGHIFVAAAGNESSDNDLFPAYPPSYDVDNVVAVAATDHNDDLAWFSNYGATSVDLGAPGLDILSTFPTYLTDAMLSEGFSTHYASISGTSMATPHVAGTLALIRGQHLDWTYDQVIQQLLATTDDTDALAGFTANGRLNAAAAVGNPVPDTSGPRVIASSPGGATTGPVSSVRLRFNEPLDPATFGTSDVAEFTGPAGALSVQSVVPVAGTSNRQFDVTFAPQSAEGAYSLVIGPHIADRFANEMNQDNDGANGEPADDQYRANFSIVDTIVVHSTDVPAPIFDLTAVGSYLTVPDNVTIGDLNVQLNITHTYVGDLAIYLISPLGNYTFLSYFYGGSGNNFQDTIFDDEATTPIWAGTAPYIGSYQPDTPLSVFDGENAAGLWQLWIEDWGFFDEGWLNAWSIEITPAGSAPPPPPPGNEPPVPGYDYFETQEETALVLTATADLLVNDFDPNGDSFTLIGVGDAFGGSVAFDGVDTVTFTPDADFTGFGSFSYTIQDSLGAAATGFVDVNVLPANDPPIAVDDSAVTSSDTPLVFEGGQPGALSLLANDFDPDGDLLTLVGVVDGSANHGVAVFDPGTGAITFTPETGYLGTASFQYIVTDGLEIATATVMIDVVQLYYFSAAAPGTVVGSEGVSLSFSDADIVRLSITASGEYSYELYFQGADVGLTNASEDIDSFAILPDGTIIVSTVGSYNVPGGFGTLTGGGNNLLAFAPDSLGASTSGQWSLYLQGSSVGLSGSAENIDALAVLADGSIVVSTTGNVAVPGVSGVDADLLRYNAGLWSMYFDGSDVGLTTNGENVDGLFVREDEGGGLPTLHLSTRGNFAALGVSGANEDILEFVPASLGATTSGAYKIALDGSLVGLGAHDLDGIYLGLAPNQGLAQSASTESASTQSAIARVADRLAPGSASHSANSRVLALLALIEGSLNRDAVTDGVLSGIDEIDVSGRAHREHARAAAQRLSLLDQLFTALGSRTTDDELTLAAAKSGRKSGIEVHQATEDADWSGAGGLIRKGST
ncbi:MAG: S8 family serine peptidase, partial [Planctomycetaceae bacterium]|nr:S8 family serine peptidase [Planctomycetaceae bacterium]